MNEHKERKRGSERRRRKMMMERRGSSSRDASEVGGSHGMLNAPRETAFV